MYWKQMVHSKIHGGSFLLVLAALASHGCHSSSNIYAPSPPPEVTTVQPLVRDVVLFVDENGETESVGKAEVRSRVRGILKEIHFQSGQLVEQGTLLFSIEDDTYKASESAAAAALGAAQAEVLVARSNISVRQAFVEQSQSEFARQEQLIAQRATSQAEYDVAKANMSSTRAALEAAQATLAAAEASVRQAEARLESARLELDYTQIRAPIRGRLTQSLVQLGNLLEPGTSLLSVIDSETLYVNFTVGDRKAMEISQSLSQPANKQDRGPSAWAKTPVLIAREIDAGFPFKGQMEYVAQEGVDVSTGTLRLRALVENKNAQLFPGLFVRLRIPVALLREATLLPETVIQSDRSQKFVLVVDEENHLRRQPVLVRRRGDGWVVVSQGVSKEDQIVYDGFHLVSSNGVTPNLRSYSTGELPSPEDEELVQLLGWQ